MVISPFLITQPMTWVIILAVVLVLFGATRLPALSKSLGQSIKIFRKEVVNDEASEADKAQETSSDKS